MHCSPLSAPLNFEAWDVNSPGVGASPDGVLGGQVGACTEARFWSCSGRSLQTDVRRELVWQECSEAAL